MVFYFEMLNGFDIVRPGSRLLDLGGGISSFAPMASELGFETILIDDFEGGGGVAYPTNSNQEQTSNARPLAPGEVSAQESKLILERMQAHGIHVHKLDFLSAPLPIETESIDVATCIHSLEHWHNTPKPLFAELRRIIKSGGYLLLVTPNAVNLRKRIAVVMGKSNLPTLDQWYNEPTFRGHVREPVIGDLCRLLEWNKFVVREIAGRNFIGRCSEQLAFLPKWMRYFLARNSERFLKYLPSLCSDLHVLGQKV
jgi:SAM-dependent methyltransferase